MTWFIPCTRFHGIRRGWRLSQAWPTGRRATPSPVTITSVHSMKKLWKSKPRLKAMPQPIAIASAAKDPLWVSEISTTASTKPRAHAAIGTPGQRITRRLSGLSGRKLMRAHTVSAQIEANISATDSPPRCFPHVTPAAGAPAPREWRFSARRAFGALDVQFFDVEVAQFGRRGEPVIDQDAQQPQHVAGAVQVDSVLAGQRLDRLQFADVPLREAPPVGRGALGNDEAEVLVHHQRARVRLENLRRHADGIDRLIEGQARVARCAAGYSFSQSSMPSERLVGVVRALMRYSCAPSRSPRATRSSSS